MKRIICCSDGTWNKPDEKDNGIISPTNVVTFKKMLLSKDKSGIIQKAFYDEGVGTKWYNKFTGGLFGLGINENILDAYKFIVENYEKDDEIYLFGFSRGAYTARSVAGFIYNCGLLKKMNNKLLKEAFLLYKDRNDDTKPSSDKATDFRNKYCYDNVKIKCVGVWDTVGALGIPLDIFDKINKDLFNTQFYDVRLNKTIEFAFHAVAIDEHRKPFVATLWEQDPDANANGQILEQVWFTGVHSDVGGGYSNTDLANCTLNWMIEKAKTAGLAFKNDVITGNGNGEMHDSMTNLYEKLGTVNRKMNNGIEFNESLSQEARNRWNADINNYKANVNPNILPFVP